MNAPETPNQDAISKEVASALDWWREAGVDSEFSDDATKWLRSGDKPVEGANPASPAPTARATAPHGPKNPAHSADGKRERVDFFAEGKPSSLEEFREFWITAPKLDPAGPRGRVAPRGPSHADVMVLVVDPEVSDRDRLLSGPQGELLSSILSAMQVDVERVYVASALPRHTPLADTQAHAEGGMDAVLSHHIGLVQPKRLMGFGAGLAPFFDQNVNKGDAGLRESNYNTLIKDVLLGEGLDTLMTMPLLKARFWQRWIEWSA